MFFGSNGCCRKTGHIYPLASPPCVGRCGSSSRRTTWLFSLGETREEVRSGISWLMNSWTVGGVCHFSLGPPRHAQEPSHLPGLHVALAETWVCHPARIWAKPEEEVLWEPEGGRPFPSSLCLRPDISDSQMLLKPTELYFPQFCWDMIDIQHHVHFRCTANDLTFT